MIDNLPTAIGQILEEPRENAALSVSGLDQQLAHAAHLCSQESRATFGFTLEKLLGDIPEPPALACRSDLVENPAMRDENDLPADAYWPQLVNLEDYVEAPDGTIWIIAELFDELQRLRKPS